MSENTKFDDEEEIALVKTIYSKYIFGYWIVGAKYY